MSNDDECHAYVWHGGDEQDIVVESLVAALHCCSAATVPLAVLHFTTLVWTQVIPQVHVEQAVHGGAYHVGCTMQHVFRSAPLESHVTPMHVAALVDAS